MKTKTKERQVFEKMKIIVVKGKDRSGKTTSLKLLIHKLLGDSKFRLYDKSRKFDTNLNRDNYDVWAKFCYGGVHILIVTQGDCAKDVAELIKKQGEDCDIVVCAAHPKYRASFGDWNEQDIREIDKEAQSNKEQFNMANEQFAKNLLKELVDLVEAERKYC